MLVRARVGGGQVLHTKITTMKNKLKTLDQGFATDLRHQRTQGGDGESFHTMTGAICPPVGSYKTLGPVPWYNLTTVES